MDRSDWKPRGESRTVRTVNLRDFRLLTSEQRHELERYQADLRSNARQAGLKKLRLAGFDYVRRSSLTDRVEKNAEAAEFELRRHAIIKRARKLERSNRIRNKADRFGQMRLF